MLQQCRASLARSTTLVRSQERNRQIYPDERTLLIFCGIDLLGLPSPSHLIRRYSSESTKAEPTTHTAIYHGCNVVFYSSSLKSVQAYVALNQFTGIACYVSVGGLGFIRFSDQLAQRKYVCIQKYNGVDHARK